MARSVEQRIKELVEPNTRAYAVTNWNDSTSNFAKDLNAPIFKKSGDVASLAKKFDVAGDNFIAASKKKDDSKSLFDTSNDAMMKTEIGRAHV